MTSEMTEKSYQGIRCFYCSEPIRLSTRMLGLCHVESDSTTAELQCTCQAFNLRCDACSREIRYLKSEIETFEVVGDHSGVPSGRRVVRGRMLDTRRPN
jgi:hypothetical protein